MSKVIGVLTGHCPIGRHAERLGAPYRRCCRSYKKDEDKETITHLLCDCLALSRARFRNFEILLLDDPSKIADVKVMYLMRFIKESKWMEDET